MAKKQFQAESKRLLDLMINSIYTNREIFLRELISNASDALDKLYYTSLKSGSTGVKRSNFVIRIAADKDARTLTVSDNGIGMSAEELESNLGTIARSGSLSFKEDMELDDDKKSRKITDIIGQFGVGFYSAFMVAEEVTVTSKKFGSDDTFVWKSSGADGYTIEKAVDIPSSAEIADSGTVITLVLKEDTDDENYSQYLNDYTIKSLVKQYSDYIHYPVKLGDDTLNSMEPIWKRQKSKVDPKDYNEFYKSRFNDYVDPARVIRTAVEGMQSYTALLFIPGMAPFNYYNGDYEKGLALYSSGVLIMERCKELIPDHFSFVRGLVDSQDLNLNISREMLQKDRQLIAIERNLEKKIKKDLLDFLKNDRDEYEKFFDNFGRQLKFGVYDNYGANKDLLSDLIMFTSSKDKKMTTLDEYIERMQEDQKYIYFAPGETIEKIDMLPHVAAAKAKDIEVLYLTDEIDEFVLRVMFDYKGKEFRSVSDEDFRAELSDSESARLDDITKTNEDFLRFVKTTVNGTDASDSIENLDPDLLKIAETRFSLSLGDAPVMLTVNGMVSLEMEKTFKRMPIDRGVRAEKVLELNPDSPSVKKLMQTYSGEESERAEAAVRLLYDQAVLLSGLEIDDPVRMGKDIVSLIG
ncbi:MAG: molecular chaperone HtpG [Eubacterium sp.]|nr:molecular chaperone HtpG [Eubacterium sp.]